MLLLEHGNTIPPKRDLGATATADLSWRGRLVDGYVGNQTAEVRKEEMQTDQLHASCKPKILYVSLSSTRYLVPGIRYRYGTCTVWHLFFIGQGCPHRTLPVLPVPSTGTVPRNLGHFRVPRGILIKSSLYHWAPFGGRAGEVQLGPSAYGLWVVLIPLLWY